MRVADLEGADLDYWVARAEGFAHTLAREAQFALDGHANPCIFTTSRGDLRLARADSVTAWNPSTDWSCGGLIIERERMHLEPFPGGAEYPEWMAFDQSDGWGEPSEDSPLRQYGDTALIVAMRAYVATKFGKEVPDSAKDAPAVLGKKG